MHSPPETHTKGYNNLIYRKNPCKFEPYHFKNRDDNNDRLHVRIKVHLAVITSLRIVRRPERLPRCVLPLYRTRTLWYTCLPLDAFALSFL
jgi:hypothetical protein